jgi:dipeptidyl aminopeptidase/acylaminoacyl peptidase
MLATTGLLLALAASGQVAGGAPQIAGGAPQPITGIENAFPAWSPDGSRIVFQSNRSGEWHLYLMTPDGEDLRDLTPGLKDCRNPSFSPDGKMVVFYSASSGNDEIYVMGADGSGPRNLTHNPARDIHPHWTPDGKRIVFNSTRDDPAARVRRLRHERGRERRHPSDLDPRGGDVRAVLSRREARRLLARVRQRQRRHHDLGTRHEGGREPLRESLRQRGMAELVAGRQAPCSSRPTARA